MLFIIVSSSTYAEGKKWYTHWNGKRMQKSDNAQFPPSVSMVPDPSRYRWQLSNLFENKTEVSSGAVPIYDYDPNMNSFHRRGFKETGLEIDILKMNTFLSTHYFGVRESSNENGPIFWVSGSFIINLGAKKE